jgi:small subunit ribosomal protein S6
VTDYEILLLLDAELPDERQQEIVTRARELIERGGGQFARHDAWGRRRLAYEIDRKAEGTYHLLTFAAESDVLDEVSRVLKITDGVLRHMAVRRPAAKATVRKEAPAVAPPVRESGRPEAVAGSPEAPPATTEPPAEPAAAEEAVSVSPPDE